MGLEQRVIGMTFSEFGRRIRSNDSLGTDHGDAAPLILFGNCITPGVLGDNPEIDTEVGIGDGIPYQFDFRDVYGSVLLDWFKVEEEEVEKEGEEDNEERRGRSKKEETTGTRRTTKAEDCVP